MLAVLQARLRSRASHPIHESTGWAGPNPPFTLSRTLIEHRFGQYGGQYVPETLMPALAELEQAWLRAREDPAYRAELDGLLRDFGGRPTPLYHARRLSERCGRKVYLKREDLNHTGSHKLNNALGQALLARRMGKRRIIAETGAGQHGVATATVCALLDLQCEIYMGAEDTRRQRPNVQRMELLGATVHEVDAGARTLKEATSAAIRDWVTNVQSTHYVIGSVVGPAPYPALVRDLQRVIGEEARAQLLEREGRLPGRVIACVGGGSNALGIFTAFLDDPMVKLIGVEAGGEGIDAGGGGRHGAPLTVGGRAGVLHGARSAVMQDEEGQIIEAHSISAGLDYPGTGPQHAHLRDSGRARYVAVSDCDALAAFGELARLEGIIPALETAHALAFTLGVAETRTGGKDAPHPTPAAGDRPPAAADSDLDLVCLSGRGDKDLAEVLARS
ncbi:MAG TPA: tryptophan synthase subunit beta [Solirubrobacteraceae bacterium]|jgi:tryptophan synthase beta chain|nr:tryptophan synthase subunit beta [Solirubrobacteraceae bacterium]